MRLPDFNPEWNDHYDYNDPANRAEIERVHSYDIATDNEVYVSGTVIESPWGVNRIVAVSSAHGQDMCIKEITVRPGYMLSLQRHRSRDELWQIKTGTLSLIVANQRLSLKEGDAVNLPAGTVHCMANMCDYPVTVIETQHGINRESDNIRLMDMHGRPIYPLMSAEEYHAAQLYAQLAENVGTR